MMIVKADMVLGFIHLWPSASVHTGVCPCVCHQLIVMLLMVCLYNTGQLLLMNQTLKRLIYLHLTRPGLIPIIQL